MITLRDIIQQHPVIMEQGSREKCWPSAIKQFAVTVQIALHFVMIEIHSLKIFTPQIVLG
jgi:hypothetical protein